MGCSRHHGNGMIDKSTNTIFVHHYPKDYFYQFGELRSISIVPRQNCAFVCFSSRASAEVAAERSFNKLVLKGRRLKIMWGKSQGQQPTPGKQGGTPLVPVPGLPGALPPPPTESNSEPNYFNLASQTDAPAKPMQPPHMPQVPPRLPPPPTQRPGMPLPPPPPMHMGPHGRPMPPPPQGFPPPPPFGMPQFGMPPPFFHGPPPGMERPPRPGPPPGPPPVHYPSQDPHRLGAAKGQDGGPPKPPQPKDVPSS